MTEPAAGEQLGEQLPAPRPAVELVELERTGRQFVRIYARAGALLVAGARILDRLLGDPELMRHVRDVVDEEQRRVDLHLVEGRARSVDDQEHREAGC